MIYFEYSLIQLVNVVLSTIKSITTIKCNKWIAAITNAIYYGFYVVVILFTINEFSLWAKILIATAVNFIGVMLGRFIMDKAKKDKLWEIKGIVGNSDYEQVLYQLKSSGQKFIITVMDTEDNTKVVTVLTHNKDESRVVRDIFQRHFVVSIANEQNAQL